MTQYMCPALFSLTKDVATILCHYNTSPLFSFMAAYQATIVIFYLIISLLRFPTSLKL